MTDLTYKEICAYCKGERILEIRVQLDQKVYVDCLCTGNTLQGIAREAFQAGYKRAKSDEAAGYAVAIELLRTIRTLLNADGQFPTTVRELDTFLGDVKEGE